MKGNILKIIETICKKSRTHQTVLKPWYNNVGLDGIGWDDPKRQADAKTRLFSKTSTRCNCQDRSGSVRSEDASKPAPKSRSTRKRQVRSAFSGSGSSSRGKYDEIRAMRKREMVIISDTFLVRSESKICTHKVCAIVHSKRIMCLASKTGT